MLRASADAISAPLDPRAITDRSIDPKLAAGSQLLAFTDAALGDGDLHKVRVALEAVVGWDGVAAAAGVVGNFEMMNRIADATGMPVAAASLARTEEWRAELGLDRFRH